MKLPLLFLAGAPKCGTSALYHQLVRHKSVVGSEPKETFFTLPANHPLAQPEKNIEHNGWEGLRNAFPAKLDSVTWLLEATTHTLYHPECFETFGIPEGAHFIVLLRDPVDRLRSSFFFFFNNLARFRKTLKFDAYVNLLLNGQEEQLNEYLFESPSLYVLKRDLRYGQYSDYLEIWQQMLPEDRLRVVLYEDFRHDPVTTTNALFTWLQLEPLNIQSKVLNKTQSIRSKQFHRWILKINRLVPQGQWKQSIKQLYYRLQSSNSARIQVSDDVRIRLSAHYAPYQEKLEVLLGRKIEYWS